MFQAEKKNICTFVNMPKAFLVLYKKKNLSKVFLLITLCLISLYLVYVKKAQAAERTIINNSITKNYIM